MSDSIPAPEVRKILRCGKFELHILAYRKLSFQECQEVGKQWLKSSKRKSFPSAGVFTVLTTIGLPPE